MSTPFLVIAAVMVLAALACALVPMLRSARREGRPRTPFVLALVLALLMPPVVLGAYLMIGTPQALQPVSAEKPGDLADATRQLRESLQRAPDDARGWALLAQAYSALGKPGEARDALDHLLQLKPDDPDAMVAWVEATAAIEPSHRIDDASRARLEHALQIDPGHQRALWLLGISDFQRQDYAAAAAQWRILLPMLPAGSKVAAAVQQELTEAEARAEGTPAPPKADPAPSASVAPTRDAGLTVKVTVAPKLAARVKPDDTLYVFATAVDGPAMPLAVARMKASRLPAEVRLTDAMRMTPALALSNFAKVRVAARISDSGDAKPQPGDLEATPVETSTRAPAPVVLTIDRLD